MVLPTIELRLRKRYDCRRNFLCKFHSNLEGRNGRHNNRHNKISTLIKSPRFLLRNRAKEKENRDGRFCDLPSITHARSWDYESNFSSIRKIKQPPSRGSAFATAHTRARRNTKNNED